MSKCSQVVKDPKNVIICRNVDINALKHEAQFYGIGPLLKRLMLCDELNQCECGDVLFHGFLPAPPHPPIVDHSNSFASASDRGIRIGSHSRNLSEPIIPSPLPSQQSNPIRPLPTMDAKFQACATKYTKIGLKENF